MSTRPCNSNVPLCRLSAPRRRPGVHAAACAAPQPVRLAPWSTRGGAPSAFRARGVGERHRARRVIPTSLFACNSNVPLCRLSAPRRRPLVLMHLLAQPRNLFACSCICLHSPAICSPCSVVDARRCSFSLSGAWCWRAASCACVIPTFLFAVSQLLLQAAAPFLHSET